MIRRTGQSVGPAIRILGVNVGPQQPLPVDGAIQIAVDRYLLPGTVNRQSVGLVGTSAPKHVPALVSILTPSIPERERFRRECCASVTAQTFASWEHLVHVDDDRAGCAVTMNMLAAVAEGEWLLPLADDDLLLPGALEVLLEADGDAPTGLRRVT